MNKSELVKKIEAKFGYLPTNVLKNILETVLSEIGNTLSDGGRAEFRGLGSFSVRKRAARKVRNPRTNQEIFSDDKYVVYFRMGKKLKEMLNQ